MSVAEPEKTKRNRPGAAALLGSSRREGWPAARFLATLAEHETADRARRRIERHMAEARLPAGKTLRRLRLRKRADGVEGAGDGARVRRRLAQQRGQLAVFPPGGGRSHSRARHRAASQSA